MARQAGGWPQNPMAEEHQLRYQARSVCSFASCFSSLPFPFLLHSTPTLSRVENPRELWTERLAVAYDDGGGQGQGQGHAQGKRSGSRHGYGHGPTKRKNGLTRCRTAVLSAKWVCIYVCMYVRSSKRKRGTRTRMSGRTRHRPWAMAPSLCTTGSICDSIPPDIPGIHVWGLALTPPLVPKPLWHPMTMTTPS